MPAGATADAAGGEYRLVLVATRGKAAGQRVEGRLSLQPNEGDLRYGQVPALRRDTTVRYPLAGTTDVDLASVGAVHTGDTMSDDPMRPGVLVIQHAGTLVIRLGADANRRDAVRFDGGYTALRVHQIDDGRLAGTWESGTTTPVAGGHFCIARTNS